MRKPETSGERIKALRGAETQERFARKLGVTRGAVSAWEKDDELRRPSAAIYLKLACLASDPGDAGWFLQKAEIESDLIFRLAATLGRKPIGGGGPGGVAIYVRPLDSMAGAGGEPYPASRLRHPDSVRSLVLPPGSGSEIFRADDTVLVDTGYTKEEALLPYWEELILLSFPIRPGEPGKVYELKLEGPQIGRLTLEPPHLIRNGGSALEYQAAFEPLMGRSEVVGTWRSGDIGPAIDARAGIDYVGLEMLARREMKLFDGLLIHGHVVGWIGFGPDAEPWDGPGMRAPRKVVGPERTVRKKAEPRKRKRLRRGGKGGRTKR